MASLPVVASRIMSRKKLADVLQPTVIAIPMATRNQAIRPANQDLGRLAVLFFADRLWSSGACSGRQIAKPSQPPNARKPRGQSVVHRG